MQSIMGREDTTSVRGHKNKSKLYDDHHQEAATKESNDQGDASQLKLMQ